MPPNSHPLNKSSCNRNPEFLKKNFPKGVGYGCALQIAYHYESGACEQDLLFRISSGTQGVAKADYSLEAAKKETQAK